MSSTFAGSSTKSTGSFEREIEKRLDIFTDEFDAKTPPGDRDRFADKPKGFGKPHDDSPAEAEPGFVRAAAAGNASDQEPLDEIDQAEHERNAGIKPAADQFPTGKTMAREIKSQLSHWSGK